jgi:hypothetical protein
MPTTVDQRIARGIPGAVAAVDQGIARGIPVAVAAVDQGIARDRLGDDAGRGRIRP